VRSLTPAAGASEALGEDGVLYWRADLF
jgi:hypothetical protein